MAFYRVVLPYIVLSILVVPPSIWGMRRGARLGPLRPLTRTVLVIAAVITPFVIAVQSWIGWQFANPNTRPNIWSGGLILPVLLQILTCWPVAYLAVSAIAPRWKASHA